jgi:predicted RNase H-like HicB family nuclease
VVKHLFTASVALENELFIAQCIEVNVASQGVTEDEALENLRDAVALHFTPPLATIISHIMGSAGSS